MAAETKIAVINLYKRLFKLGKCLTVTNVIYLARNWHAKDPSRTAVEREDILHEIREKFRANREASTKIFSISFFSS